MKLAYQQLANEQEAALLKDLADLIAIDSVRDMSKATAEYPVGPGPVKALDKFLAFAQRDGFAVENLDNYAGTISWGTGEEELGIAIHVDVVPPDLGWQSDPFKMTIKNGRVYGRGSSDNKGPALACYYAALALKKAGFVPRKKITFIIGTDEETDWVGMKYYLQKRPAPTWLFSPDSSFPLVNGQAGLAVLKTTFTRAQSPAAPLKLVSFKSGQATNMVPASATATIAGTGLLEVKERFGTFLTQTGLSGKASRNRGQLDLFLEGTAAHASIPFEGKNGGSYLAKFLKDLAFAGRDLDFLTFAGDKDFADYYGEKIGIANTDPQMGRSINCPGVFFYEGAEGYIKSDIRYSRGSSPEKMCAQLNANWGSFSKTDFQPYEDFEKPHYVPEDDPFVQKLLAVYRKQTGDCSKPIVSAGANYGRFFKNGLGFGPAFPGSLDSAHAIDESVAIADLIKSMAIYMECIYEICQ